MWFRKRVIILLHELKENHELFTYFFNNFLLLISRKYSTLTMLNQKLSKLIISVR